MGTHLAGGIAHDFNNLLGAVLAQAELALEELAAGSHPEVATDGSRNVVIHGSEIVRAVADLCRKDSEDLRTRSTFLGIIKQMVDLFEVFSLQSTPRWKLIWQKDLPAIRANAAQLRQIIVTLITNASEAIGDRDGVNRVATGHVAIDRPAAAVEKGVTEGDCTCNWMYPTRGAACRRKPTVGVFDPFFRKSPGRGLGLAVVQGIVQSLRGAIHLASEPGKGTTFQILLPSEAGAEGTGDPIPQAEEVHNRR